MACNSSFCHRVPTSCGSPCNSTVFPLLKTNLLFRKKNFNQPRLRSCSVMASSFSWNDIFQVCQGEDALNDTSNLQGYFEKIRICNRGSEMQSEFLPFIIEEQIAGYIHNRFADHLRKFQDVFRFPQDNSCGGHFGDYVTLHPLLRAPGDRTRAVGDVITNLGAGLIPGIRNELYPVTSSYRKPEFFSLERAAAPYFGIKAYGVHMNGFVDKDGEKYLWIGKRSQLKATYPGMLDHLVAGGLVCDKLYRFLHNHAT